MNTYERPVVRVDEGLAEGVYAASGVDPHGFTVKYQSTNPYWEENGTQTYEVSWNTGKLISYTLEFNQNIGSASSSGTVSCSGNKVTVSYGWECPSPQTITVYVYTGLSALQLLGYSCVIE